MIEKSWGFEKTVESKSTFRKNRRFKKPQFFSNTSGFLKYLRFSQNLSFFTKPQVFFSEPQAKTSGIQKPQFSPKPQVFQNLRQKPQVFKNLRQKPQVFKNLRFSQNLRSFKTSGKNLRYSKNLSFQSLRYSENLRFQSLGSSKTSDFKASGLPKPQVSIAYKRAV